MTMCRRITLLVGLCTCAALGACARGTGDLQDFVAKVKARPATPIEPIPQIMPYQPFTYPTGDRRAPFTPTISNNEPAPASNGLSPDLKRTRDPLEAFPLDALRMVGTISRGDVKYALIQAPDNVIHRVTRGDHLGQNFGRIDSVSEDAVILTEIVPDGRGGYVKRPATIAPSS